MKRYIPALIGAALVAVATLAFAGSPVERAIVRRMQQGILPPASVGNSEIAANAAIALSKLATGALPAGITVTDTNVVDGSLANADLNSAAAIAATKVSGTAVTYSTAYQVDTNDTTDTTLYTPAFIGQVLVGFQGSGTNAVWNAKDATTNGWVIVEP